jgi:hypothetical protein
MFGSIAPPPRHVCIPATAAQTKMVFPAKAAPFKNIATRFSCQRNFNFPRRPAHPHLSI